MAQSMYMYLSRKSCSAPPLAPSHTSSSSAQSQPAASLCLSLSFSTFSTLLLLPSRRPCCRWNVVIDRLYFSMSSTTPCVSAR